MMSYPLLLTILSLLASAQAQGATTGSPSSGPALTTLSLGPSQVPSTLSSGSSQSPSSLPVASVMSQSPTSLATSLAPSVAVVESDAPSDVPSQVPSSLVTPTPTANANTPTLEPLTYVDFLATANREDITDTSQHFIVRITELSMINMARDEVKLTDGWTMVSGTVVPETVDWNPDWSFYLAPKSIFLSAFFPESCDATIDDVESKLDQIGSATFLPDSEWCPWTSRLISELEATEAPSAAPSQARPAAIQPTDDASASAQLLSLGRMALVMGVALMALA